MMNNIDNNSDSRIFIVDDNESILDILKDMLTLEGYRVETCTKSEEALEKTKANPPDLLILDIRMPGIDGIELCRQFKSDPLTAQIPVIFISGLMGMDEKIQGFRAGGADYITKPFHNLDVLVRVGTHIQLRKRAILLEGMNEYLEEMVEKRTAELRIAKEAAENANKAKSQFLSNINHEMRTPLNGIIGMLKLMGNLPMDENMEMYHSLAEFSARHLSSVISDILDYTQLDAGSMKFHYRPFSAASCLKKLCLLHQPQAESKGLTLEWILPEDAEPFITDENRLIQIAGNLLTNAVKYSREGRILLRCRQSDVLTIDVEDQGSGIPVERQDEIFQPFMQLESPYTKEHSGMGLGLAICRNLAQSMGGSIQVESEPGRGSRFTIVLPEQTEEEDSNVECDTSEKILRPDLKILVVEDDTINLFLLENILESRGWEVFQAVNGIEAIEELKQNKPHLVLLDMGLPGKSGVEVLKVIRGMEEFKDLPVIAVTAYSHKEDLDLFRNTGINDVITKPISEQALINAVTRYLGEKKTEI